MRKSLIAVCTAGLLACTVAFCGLVLAPQAAERHVRAAVIALLKKELTERIGTGLADREVVGRVRQSLDQRIGALRSDLESPVTDLAAAIFAHLCHYECGTPSQVADSMRSGIRARIDRLQAATRRVEAWATSRYADLVSEFVNELRIFTGSNAALLLLAVLGLARAPSSRGVQTVATLLMAATFVTAYFYVANQNWLLTFVLADYVGWAYLAWVGVVFAFLVDMTFLRGNITNAIVSAIGAPLSGAS